MANEIERKFLVDREIWKPEGEGVLYRQGYLSNIIERVVRIRILRHPLIFRRSIFATAGANCD